MNKKFYISRCLSKVFKWLSFAMLICAIICWGHDGNWEIFGVIMWSCWIIAGFTEIYDNNYNKSIDL